MFLKSGLRLLAKASMPSLRSCCAKEQVVVVGMCKRVLYAGGWWWWWCVCVCVCACVCVCQLCLDLTCAWPHMDMLVLSLLLTNVTHDDLGWGGCFGHILWQMWRGRSCVRSGSPRGERVRMPR
jgi:hypothetical protein